MMRKIGMCVLCWSIIISVYYIRKILLVLLSWNTVADPDGVRPPPIWDQISSFSRSFLEYFDMWVHRSSISVTRWPLPFANPGCAAEIKFIDSWGGGESAS